MAVYKPAGRNWDWLAEALFRKIDLPRPPKKICPLARVCLKVLATIPPLRKKLPCLNQLQNIRSEPDWSSCPPKRKER